MNVVFSIARCSEMETDTGGLESVVVKLGVFGVGNGSPVGRLDPGRGWYCPWQLLLDHNSHFWPSWPYMSHLDLCQRKILVPPMGWLVFNTNMLNMKIFPLLVSPRLTCLFQHRLGVTYNILALTQTVLPINVFFLKTGELICFPVRRSFTIMTPPLTRLTTGNHI